LQVIAHIDKVSTVRRCSYMSAARDIFSAKISGTFKRFVHKIFPGNVPSVGSFMEASLYQTA